MQPEKITLNVKSCIKRVRRELMVKATLNVRLLLQGRRRVVTNFRGVSKATMYDGNNGLLKAMTEQT